MNQQNVYQLKNWQEIIVRAEEGIRTGRFPTAGSGAGFTEKEWDELCATMSEMLGYYDRWYGPVEPSVQGQRVG